jgi:hypothetical protein
MPHPSPIQVLAPFMGVIQPWVVTAALAGVASGGLFCLFAGRGLASLALYPLLGLIVGPLTVALLNVKTGAAAPVTIGEVDLVVVLIGTWLLLTFARALRL